MQGRDRHPQRQARLSTNDSAWCCADGAVDNRLLDRSERRSESSTARDRLGPGPGGHRKWFSADVPVDGQVVGRVAAAQLVRRAAPAEKHRAAIENPALICASVKMAKVMDVVDAPVVLCIGGASIMQTIFDQVESTSTTPPTTCAHRVCTSRSATGTGVR